MREFRVTLTQRAGEFARVAQALASADVNLKSVAGISDGHKALICIVVEEVAAARAALQEARVQFEEEEVLSELIENGPGAIADLTNCLAEAGIDIHSMYILARDEPLVEMGLTVDNPKKAKRVLADR